MSKYKRRVVLASIAIHIAGLLALFTYWLLNPDLEIAQKEHSPPPENTWVEGNESNAPNSYDDKVESTDTGKDPNENFEKGDLSNKQVRDLLSNQIGEDLTTEEKAKKLNEKFNALNRTPIKHVEGASETVLNALDVKPQKSKEPMTERFSKNNGGKIDIETLRLYDYEIVDGKYALIYKDKNNVYIKNDPVALSEIDSDTKLRLNLIKKAKENKKFRILLDATEDLLQNF